MTGLKVVVLAPLADITRVGPSDRASGTDQLERIRERTTLLWGRDTPAHYFGDATPLDPPPLDPLESCKGMILHVGREKMVLRDSSRVHHKSHVPREVQTNARDAGQITQYLFVVKCCIKGSIIAHPRGEPRDQASSSSPPVCCLMLMNILLSLTTCKSYYRPAHVAAQPTMRPTPKRKLPLAWLAKAESANVNGSGCSFFSNTPPTQ